MDRHDDALNATPAAVEDGILSGGGVALLKASLVLSINTPGTSNLPPMLTPNPYPQRTLINKWGVSIIHRVLTHPARTILNMRGKNPWTPSLAHYGAPDKFAWECNAE